MDRQDPTDPTGPNERPREPEAERAGGEQPTEAQGEPAASGQPTEPQGEGGAEPPTEPQPPAAGEPPTKPPSPRRLYRSRTERMLGGVCGGLGRYFNLDPVLVRIAFVVLLLAGGASLIAYVALLLLVPVEPLPPDAGAGAAAAGANGAVAEQPGRGRTLAILALALIGGLLLASIAVPLVLLALLGLLVWWVVSGERPAGGAGEVARRSALGVAVLVASAALFLAGAWVTGIGGGAIAAGVVIAAGVALLVGAFFGRLRVLILPAVAVALGIGVMAAADVDLSGGYGERSFAPASATELPSTYELGAGELVVDLRDVDLPPGDTELDMRIGVGEAVLVVPTDVCVATDASVGAGNVSSFGRDNGGVDLRWTDEPRAGAGNSRLLVDAEVGFGELRMQHEPWTGHDGHSGPSRGDGPFRDGRDRSDEVGAAETQVNAGCAPASTAAAGA